MEKESQSYQILAVVSMCGECAEKTIELLLPQSSYRHKLFRKLLRDDMLSMYVRDGLESYRLTKKGKEWMLLTDNKRFGVFLENGADFTMRKSALYRRQRQHRISEIMAMMLKSHFAVYRDEKPAVFAEQASQSVTVREPIFYSVREVKEQTMLMRKISNSRIGGILLDESQLWFCYNTGMDIPKWYENVEKRADFMIRTILQSCNLQYRAANAVLFGYDMQQAVICMNDPKCRTFFLHGPFTRFCYIPLGMYGSYLLRLLADREKYQQLKAILTEDLYDADVEDVIENDGYNKDGKPVLVAVDFDMRRLLRFHLQLRYAGRQGEVICFDFQGEVMKEYCGESAKVSTVDFEVFQENFFPAGE